MKKDPVKTAQEILKAFGGKENVISATHCATRLRVEVKDASVIDVEAMKEISGVAGYFSKSGQHQVILGTGFVNKVSILSVVWEAVIERLSGSIHRYGQIKIKIIWSLKQKFHMITAGCINNSSMRLRRNCSSKKVFATV